MTRMGHQWKGLRQYKNGEISKTKHVAISGNSNRVDLRILQRLSRTPMFAYQKRFILSKYRELPQFRTTGLRGFKPAVL